MELVATIALTAVGAVGVGLMLAAFVLVGRRGGWQQALKADARGRWPAPRILLLIGALLGFAFASVLLVPGVVPWWDSSSPNAAWGQGAVFGFLIGFFVSNWYWAVRLARREHPGGADRAAQG
jgi:hypothetical protein